MNNNNSNISFRETLVLEYLKKHDNVSHLGENYTVKSAIQYADYVIKEMQSKRGEESSEWVELKHPEHNNIVIQDGDQFLEIWGTIWNEVRNYSSLKEENRKFGDTDSIKFRIRADDPRLKIKKSNISLIDIAEAFENWNRNPGIPLTNADADTWPYSKEARREAWNAAISWVEDRK